MYFQADNFLTATFVPNMATACRCKEGCRPLLVGSSPYVQITIIIQDNSVTWHNRGSLYEKGLQSSTWLFLFWAQILACKLIHWNPMQNGFYLRCSFPFMDLCALLRRKPVLIWKWPCSGTRPAFPKVAYICNAVIVPSLTLVWGGWWWVLESGEQVSILPWEKWGLPPTDPNIHTPAGCVIPRVP